MSHGEQSPIAKKKRKQKKGEKNKEKRLHQRAYMLLEKLTSKEVAKEIFDSLKKKNNFASVSSINAEFTGRFVRRLHLDPLLWLMKKGVFDLDLARNMEVVVASMNEGNGNGDGQARARIPSNLTRRQPRSQGLFPGLGTRLTRRLCKSR